jgi:hypothetical protein
MMGPAIPQRPHGDLILPQGRQGDHVARADSLERRAPSAEQTVTGLEEAQLAAEALAERLG